MSPRVEAGNVILCTAPWNSAFVEEFAAFNLGAYDDQVDAFSQALNWLMEKERTRGGAVDLELVLEPARLMNERRQRRVTPQWVGVETEAGLGAVIIPKAVWVGQGLHVMATTSAERSKTMKWTVTLKADSWDLKGMQCCVVDKGMDPAYGLSVKPRFP